MARWGKTDFKQLKDLQKKMEKVYKKETQKFVEDCARELAARLLAKVVSLTQPGDYAKVMRKMKDKNGNVITYKRNGEGYRKGQARRKLVRKKLGGTLRRGWTSKTHEEAEQGSGAPKMSSDSAREFVDKNIAISKSGGTCTIEIINSVKYASYVEYGHRTRNGGFVPGKLMLTHAELELSAQADGILNAKVKKYLEECFNA